MSAPAATHPAVRCALGLSIVGLATGCGGNDAPGPESEVASWTVAAEPLVAVGEIEGDPRYLFQEIVGATLLVDERIAVADRGYGTVRVFDRDGFFVTEMGGVGEGPGEFTYLKALTVHDPDTLEIYDSGLYRLSTFTTDGELLATRSVHGDRGNPEIYLGRFRDGSYGFAWILQTERDRGEVTPDPIEVARYEADGSFGGVLATGTGMRRFGSGPVPFSPFFHGVVAGDSVYFTDGMAEMAVVDEAGGPVVGIPLPTEPVNGAGATADLRSVLAAQQETSAFAEMILDQAPEDLPIPQVAEVLLDDRDGLWLKAYVPEEDSHLVRPFERTSGGVWWVVGLDGSVRARVELPYGLTPLGFRRDLVVGVSADDLGVERVVVHRVVR